MPLTSPIQLDIPATIGQYLDPGQLDRYFDLLMSENAKVNLVSRETSRADFDRMVAESLLPLTILSGKSAHYLDIGSGGGLPAVPLLLSGRITEKPLLCERTQKKAAALKRIIAGLDLPADVSPKEFVELKPKLKFDLITLRYVKLTQLLLKSILAVLNPSGAFVYYSEPEFTPAGCQIDRHQFIDPVDLITKSFTLFRIS